LSLSSIAAFGQAPATTTERTTGQSTTGDQGDRSDHSNWGWVGLVGLLGLGGLMKRRDVTPIIGRIELRAGGRLMYNIEPLTLEFRQD
jgi:MYXO-CTERM domain-containing protein